MKSPGHILRRRLISLEPLETRELLSAAPVASADSYSLIEDSSITASLQPASGLIHYWRFDETSGTTAADSAGSNIGALINWGVSEPRWTTGKFGNALNFGGDSNNYVITANPISSSQYTISFWANLSVRSGVNPRIIGPQESGWIVQANSSNTGIGIHTVRGSTEPVPGQWEHYAVVFDRAGGSAKTYQNGVEVASGAVPFPAAIGSWVMGHNGTLTNHNDSWNGLLDEMRIYNRLLDAGEVAALHNAPGVLANDSDADGDPLSAILVDDVDHGTLALGSDGLFTYMPQGNFVGSDSFIYRASDGSDQSAPTTVTFVVTAVNDPPVAAGDAYGVNEDAVLVVNAAAGVLSNDTDVDNASLTVATIDSPQNGTLTLNANGSFTYKPRANFFGTDSFTYRASDGSASSNTATVTITINPVQDAPHAADYWFNVAEDGVLTVDAAPLVSIRQVSQRASDLVYDPISMKIYASVPGSVVDGNSIRVVDPFAATLGSSVFVGSQPNQITVTDDGTYVYVALDGANAIRRVHLPTLTAGLQFSLGSLGAEDVEAVPGSPNSVGVALYRIGLSPRVAGAYIYDDGIARPLGAGGSNNIDFSSDGTQAFGWLPELSSKELNKFNVTTNGFVGLQGLDSAAGIGGELVWDNNRIYFDSGTVRKTQDLSLAGTYTVNGIVIPDSSLGRAFFLNGSTIYINNQNSFVLLGSLSIPGVSGGAGSPVRFGDDGIAFRTTGDQIFFVQADAISGATRHGVLTSRTDPDGDPVSATLVDDVDHGTLTFNPNGSFTYVPHANYSGTDSFQYTASDGGAPSNIATVTITVTAVNDSPIVTTTNSQIDFVENDGPMAIDEGIVITDIDSTTLSSATVTISSGFASGQDVLAFTSQGGISGTYNAANGTLLLSGTATRATYQTALRSVTYSNTSDNPTLTARVISFTVNDGSSTSVAATRSISISPVDDSPVVTTTATSLNYVQNSGAVAIDPSLGLIDVDNIDLVGAVVKIAGNYVNGQDVLGFTNQLGIIGSFDAATATLTLSGTTSVANYRSALRAVTYTNASGAPNLVPRSVTFTASSAAATSLAATRTIAINAPTVTTTGSTITYTENAAPIDIDSGLTISDPDSSTLAGASVAITGNYIAGEDVLSFTNQLGITGVFNPGSGVLTLSGTSSVTNYRTALRAVKYSNTSEAPSIATRTVAFVVTDGNSQSNPATRMLSVSAVNDAPVVTTTGTSLSYLENQTIAVDSGLTVTDVDSTVLTGATVSFTAGYTSTQDVLSFVAQSGITGSFNTATGVLTLSGTASVAAYEAALRAVAYTNTSDNPLTATRTISFVAKSSSAFSTPAVRTVTITPVNDPPQVSSSPGNGQYTENGPAAAVDAALSVSDPDSATLVGASISITGNFIGGEDLLEFVNQSGITGNFNGSSGILTLSGTASVTAYQTALRSVTYRNTSENPSTLARSVSVVVQDAAASSASATRIINVLPANDFPVVTTSAGAVEYVQSSDPITLDTALTLADVDDLILTGATLTITGNYVPTEDQLAFVSTAEITGSFDSANGRLELVGNASIAAYESALQSVTYVNLSGDPISRMRTITIVANDGTGTSLPATKEVRLAILGDMDGDGDLDNFDIDDFELALTNPNGPNGYLTQHPTLINYRERGDIDGDGDFDNFDIQPFEQLLTSGSPTGASASAGQLSIAKVEDSDSAALSPTANSSVGLAPPIGIFAAGSDVARDMIFRALAANDQAYSDDSDSSWSRRIGRRLKGVAPVR